MACTLPWFAKNVKGGLHCAKPHGTVGNVARKLVTLTAVDTGDGEPPTEVRLLRAGLQGSTKGDVLFDVDAAERTLNAWRVRAGDSTRAGMVDLEHLSLDPAAPNFDPDARAWFDFEIRGGEAWLVNLDWTADGARRLRERTQRFLSPTAYEDEDGRIVELVNVALTALPSLHGAPQLVASRHEKGFAMADDSSAQMGAVMKALGLDPKMIDKVAAALGLEAGASVDDIRTAIDAFADKMSKVEELLSGGAPAEETAEAPAETEAPAAMATAPAEEDEGKKAAAQLRRERDDALTALRALEGRDRKALVASMVAGGHEAPATAWANPEADGAEQKPAEPWASMPLDALRRRVSALSATAKPPSPQPLQSGAAAELTEAQLAICKQYNLSPAEFATMRRRSGR